MKTMRFSPLYATISVAVLLLFTMTTAQAATGFVDEFNGSSVDTTKWSVQENTETSGYSAYGGTVTVADGSITLSSSGSSFPYIHTLSNPFPASGNFVLELKMSYLTSTGWGTGLCVYNTDNPSKTVLSLWGDSSSGISLNLLNKYTFTYSPPQVFDLKLEYLSGTYTLYKDGDVIASKDSTQMPNFIMFGHPPVAYVPFSYSGVWTSIDVDYIRITQSPFVLPEYGFGAFAALGIMLAAYSAFEGFKRVHGRHAVPLN